MLKPKIMDLVTQMLAGNKRALTRLITLVENQSLEHIKIMPHIYKKCGRAEVIGITGPPGSGKSTLVNELIRVIRDQKKTVAVIAIDPSSPFSGGAVLGDRVRMQMHTHDPGVFIRSVGSRGCHGGLSQTTKEIVRLFDAFGFDVVLVETVGVGQTELSIMEIAHTTVVVLVPEAGDTVQTMKAGLLEIADIFVVNKSDLAHAQLMKEALSEMVSSIPVLQTQAIQGVGIEELRQKILDHYKSLRKNKKEWELKKFQERKQEFLDVLAHAYQKKLSHYANQNAFLKKLFLQVEKGTKDPYTAAQEVLNSFFLD